MLDLDKVKDLMCRIDEKYRRCSTLIVEGVEAKNMKAAKHYLYQKKNCNEEQAMRIIGSIKTDVPNVRGAKCKFILAVTRMYCEGQLTDGNVIQGINKSLRYITSEAHVNEYDQNLNGLSAQEVIERFSGVAKQDLEREKADLEVIDFEDATDLHDYNIVRINSFEDAEAYGEYTDWCVTHDEHMLDSYTSGDGVFYFCIRNDYKEVEKKRGEGCPLDDYGLSMIATSVNSDGSCNTITCRWNHDNGGNDHIMTPEELSRTIGRNYYKTFLPLTKEEIEQRKVEMLHKIDCEIFEAIDNSSDYNSVGEIASKLSTYSIFDHIHMEDKTVVYEFESDNGKHVLLDENGKRINDDIYDWIGGRYKNFIEVAIWQGDNFKYNYIEASSGRQLFDTYFDNRKDYFLTHGFAVICRRDKGEKLLDGDTGAISDVWYKSINPYQGGYATVERHDGYCNYIYRKAPNTPIFPEWFKDYRYRESTRPKNW